VKKSQEYIWMGEWGAFSQSRVHTTLASEPLRTWYLK
jgi:hypothetical protein